MKIIKILPLIVFFICFSSTSFSQSIFGVVRDSLNNKPISDVNFNLIKSKIGFSSNEQGFFKCKVTDLKDQMVVSSLGYQSVTVEMSKYYENKQYEINIALLPVSIELDSVTVYDKKQFYKIVALPAQESATFNRNLLKHSECVLINNSLGEEGFLKDISVTFKSKHNSYKQTVLTHYIFNFYEYNASTGAPGDLIEVVNVVSETKGKLSRFYFNFEKYKIPFTKSGLCVSLIVVERDVVENTIESKQIKNLYKSVTDLFTFSEKIPNFQIPVWSKNTKYSHEWSNEKLRYLTNNTIGSDVSFKIKVKIQR